MSESQVLNTHSQSEMGQALFKPQVRSKATTFDYIILERTCYISVGMVLNSHETKAPGEFIAEDLISTKSDARHPKRYVEGKDIERWATTRNSFLEYGTRRSPGKVRRATFPELYEVPVKLISMDIAAAQPVVTLDRTGLFHNHSAWSFVPWHLLKGVKNRSIKKTAVYRSEVKAATMPKITRDDLEKISLLFMAEYLVAVMNSSFAQQWLSAERRNKLHLYPDDWKQLPIPVASKDEQHAISRLVTKLCESIQSGAKPTETSSIEAKIDAAVNDVIRRTSR
jgi:adenine-specific DNA-methyltransferase